MKAAVEKVDGASNVFAPRLSSAALHSSTRSISRIWRMTRLAGVAILMAVLLPAGSWAGEVISNQSLTLTPDEIRAVFLGEKQLVNGVRLVPVDNRVVQDEFLSKVLQTDSRKYQARWTRKSFREGIPAPDLKGSDAEVIAYVRATRGAIGYVKTHSSGVKVLQTF